MLVAEGSRERGRTADGTSEIRIMVASAAPSANAAPSSSVEEKLRADEPAQAIGPQPGPCNLPAKRPSSFGVKQTQHIMPHGGEDSWAGGELATKSNVCPREPHAHVVAPCAIVDAGLAAKP